MTKGSSSCLSISKAFNQLSGFAIGNPPTALVNDILKFSSCWLRFARCMPENSKNIFLLKPFLIRNVFPTRRRPNIATSSASADLSIFVQKRLSFGPSDHLFHYFDLYIYHSTFGAIYHFITRQNTGFVISFGVL